MKIVQAGEFTRQFRIHRREAVLVKDRSKVLGTWDASRIPRSGLNYAERIRKDFSRPLPFTFDRLLKEGKKR